MSNTDLSNTNNNDEELLLAQFSRMQDVMTEFCDTAEEQLGPFALPWTIRFRRVLDGDDETTLEDQLQWHGNSLTEFGDLVLCRCMHCGLNNHFTRVDQGTCANCGWPKTSSKTLN